VHTYPLHHPVRAECLCCHLTFEVTFTSKTDHVICKGCTRHQGDSVGRLRLRDGDHIAGWRSELGLVDEAHGRRLQLMQQTILAYRDEAERVRIENVRLRETLRAGVLAAPHAEVEHWFANQMIGEAHDQRDAAYRSRDRAFRALWAADRLHHHDPARGDRCSCGRPASACRELQAIEGVGEALDHWERTQVDRLERGLEHGLPRDHPRVAASNSRWYSA
jgi:hypothetical protein